MARRTHPGYELLSAQVFSTLFQLQDGIRRGLGDMEFTFDATRLPVLGEKDIADFGGPNLAEVSRAAALQSAYERKGWLIECRAEVQYGGNAHIGNTQLFGRVYARLCGPKAGSQTDRSPDVRASLEWHGGVDGAATGTVRLPGGPLMEMNGLIREEAGSLLTVDNLKKRLRLQVDHESALSSILEAALRRAREEQHRYGEDGALHAAFKANKLEIHGLARAMGEFLRDL